MGDKWRAGELTDEDVEELREELDAIAAKSRLPRKLKALRQALDGPPPTPPLAQPAVALQAGDA